MSPGIAFMMADAVIFPPPSRSPPSGNPWSSCQDHPLPNFHLPFAQPLTQVRFVALTDLLSETYSSSITLFLLTPTTSSYQRMHEYTGFEYRQVSNFLPPSEQASNYRSTYISHTKKRPFHSIAYRDMYDS